MTDSSNVAEIIILGNRIDLFWVGVFGAIAVELTTIAGHYDRDAHPGKYRKPGFWLAKIGLAVVGGALVNIYGVTTAPAALQIGASASALVLALAKGEPPQRQAVPIPSAGG
jgi:hypothetical protein